jgi:phage baseplate assembly protein gpV
VYRIGIVAAQDTNNVRARVTFTDHDQMLSYWLNIAADKSHADKGYWMPDIGDKVICIMDAHDEDGAIVGAIYSPVDPPPGQTSPSTLRLTSDNAGTVSGTPLTGTYDQMFTQAAATCPGLATAIPGVSGKNVLKALATTESSLNPNAMSEPARDGSRSWGMMQINTTAHPGYSPSQLQSQVELNIRLGTADLCGKLSHYGNINDALAHYKGWNGYNASPTGKAQVDKVISTAQGLGMS